MATRLTLDQVIGVRIPVPQQECPRYTVGIFSSCLYQITGVFTHLSILHPLSDNTIPQGSADYSLLIRVLVVFHTIKR